MRDLHVSAELLDRFARGDLDDRELSEVLEHLEQCASCTRAGEARAAKDLGALHAGLSGAQTPAGSRTLVWTLAAAAAIAIAVLSLALPGKRASDERAAPASSMATPAKPVLIGPVPAAHETTVAYPDPEWLRLVDAATRSGRLPFPPDLEALYASPDTVRGTGGSVERISPAAVVLDEVRPTFTWPAREGGTYVVSVFHDEHELLHSAPLRVPRWKPDRDLPRGRTLAWQVEVTGHGAFETIPGPPSPPARFRIVTDAEHRDLVRARSLPDDPLLLAVLYARTGMRIEALASLRRAAAGNEVAKRILAHETSTAH
jgi:Putative zinc-finger